ncbi:MAG TPA: flagellar biosynthesis anti-sigma factor FlgM [Kofleriaceae bacterium]|jgi:flagellar biosynthesis anti-sigma factor FlgM|nr:flagellar biosynthesis anti-sigma factor FlgM [Kofleriaceae bacterium]
MRIETPTVAPVSNEPKNSQSAATAHQVPSPATASQSPAAVVTLSSAGTASAKQTGQIKDMPDPKVLARVAQIRQQLMSGSYPIDLDVLASKIAEDEVVRGAG